MKTFMISAFGLIEQFWFVCLLYSVCVGYRSKAMLRVLRCVETMGDVSLWAVFSCDGCMAARREGASRGDRTSGSVYTTCFSWSTSITTAPSSNRRGKCRHWHRRQLKFSRQNRPSVNCFLVCDVCGYSTHLRPWRYSCAVLSARSYAQSPGGWCPHGGTSHSSTPGRRRWDKPSTPRALSRD